MGKYFLSFLAFFLIIIAAYFAYQVRLENKSIHKDGELQLANGAKLEWGECWFDRITNVDCAYLHTAPEQEGEPSSFRLPVVVIRHLGVDHEEDPVIYMAGGPGSSAWLGKEQIKNYWVPWYKEANLHRDLVLFDQRGAGLSKPRLSCPEYYEAIRETLVTKLSANESAIITHKSLLSCYDRLKENGQPISEISTRHSARDVNDLMTLLDYDQWNLDSISYSTRLALLIEQMYPDKVRSMVLDSVYPIQRHFFKEWPELMKKSLERIFDLCEKQSSCGQEYGDLRQKLWEVVERLREEPMNFAVNSDKYKISNAYIDDETFLSILFDAQYGAGVVYDLPAVIDAFHRADEELLQSYVEDFLTYRLDDSISEVVFWAVECKDNPPLSDKEANDLYDKYPKLKPYLVEEYNVCDIWLDGQKAKGLQVNTDPSDVPVMVLGGEDDPVTPIEWVEDVLVKYKKAQMFSFTHISHSVMDSKTCSTELLSQFIDDPFTRPAADCRIDSRFVADDFELSH